MVNPLPPPAHVVDRPPLRDQLDGVVGNTLALIVAPAGSGKSVLLAQWAGMHPELAFVWLEIMSSDDDPVRFSRRLLSGLAEVRPDFADLGPLISMHGGGLGEALLEALVTQMIELPEVVIVLDDLHHLSNSALIADLGRLVELLPPNVHLVLSSRVDLPIAWSRHRLRQDIIEIRQADLAFNDSNSAELLQRITGQSLSSDSVTVLVDRTEGWVAGLQLAGMTLRVHPDSGDFVTQFGGTDRLISDYLSEEVLDAQPDARRRLLLRISVLDEMCADLIGHITGEPCAQQVLEELERESMFLVPLDSRRQWYRFHHLFRDLLRFRLRAEDPALESQLLGRAAEWHLGHTGVAAAIECLLSAGEWEGALGLILTRGSEIFEQGEMATVIRWISMVPEEVRTGRHDVSLLLGLLKGMEGQAVAAENEFRRVMIDPTSSRGDVACAQAFTASLAQWRTNTDASVEAAEAALELLDGLGDENLPVVMNLSDEQSLRAMVTISGGRAHFLAGQFDEAREWLERGLAGLDSYGSAYSVWRVHSLGSLGLLEAWCGSTDRAEALAEEALEVARSVGMLTHPSTADAYLAVTLVALERGEPRRAALSLHEGSLRAEANHRSNLTWVAHLELALLRVADGEPQPGPLMPTSPGQLGAPPPPLVAQRLRALEARLLRLGGAYREAARVSSGSHSDAEILRFEQVAAALAMGQTDKARKVMDVAPTDTYPGNPAAAVRSLIQWTWLSSVEGSVGEFERYLSEALQLAEQHSLVELFVQSGPAVIQLVAGMPEARSSFREAVLRRSRETRPQPTGNGLIDPLTDRELEILSYLPSRATNSEMAERCYVSVNTIKTHMAHIYRKLDVVNRSGAIRRAQEIGLL
jgi:LuxR family transcriptional regulator, maltose regulon positive regulatory protein